MNDFIPVNEPLFPGNEKKYLMECIDTGWVSSEGPFVEKFEKGVADFIGVSHGIALCNGTAALETALYALDVKEGDEVIMPSFTIISCAIACIRLGAVPILVDIEPVTWTMDTAQIESRISKKTRVIMPVHIYGHPVHMDDIFRLKEKYDLLILEDFAEAHGAEYYSEHYGGKWLKCGSMGDASATSFYANKILTTGEGGMVVTDGPEMADRARSYRNLCFSPENRFYHEEIGYNFRMTNLQAAVGVAQLERVDDLIAKKRHMGDYYRQRLSTIPGIRFQIEKPWAKSVYWMYAVELDPDLGIDAFTLREQLRKKGIGTRPFFLGMHAQPVLQKKLGFKPNSCPRTDHAYHYGCYLPSGMNLTEKQVDKVCLALMEIMEKK
ncbi:DegT/DnrJ/EryC1/StrS family aminotransferase [Thermodesulfobacteriota bacterium]